MSNPVFKYVKFRGVELNPRRQGGSEPKYEKVYELYSRHKQISVDVVDYVAVEIRYGDVKEAIWISRETYEKSKHILAPETVFYEAHEGVTFTSAKGAFLVHGEPKHVDPPPGISDECAIVQTELGKNLGLEPFVVEKRFLFKGFKGEDVEVGYIRSYRYFIAPYDRDTGKPLSEEALKKTLLWRNYLSRPEVLNILRKSSTYLKGAVWELERMRREALARYKVAWRDVAKRFIPTVVSDGAVPDYTVNYVVVDNIEEAYYLLAVLLSSQINAVVEELSPWVGHVQPRFLRYFRIPKFNPENPVHRGLAEIGKSICERRSVSSGDLYEIEALVNKLIR